MAGLKELRTRIETIKSTQKITSAMKMVAASSLRKAQGLIASSVPYRENILSPLENVVSEFRTLEQNGTFVKWPRMIAGSENDRTYLLLVFTSDRGLCGNFNASVAKVAARRIEELQNAGKEVKVACIGRKGYSILKRRYAANIVRDIDGIAKKGARYDESAVIANYAYDDFMILMSVRLFTANSIQQSTGKLSSSSFCRFAFPSARKQGRNRFWSMVPLMNMNRIKWKFWGSLCRCCIKLPFLRQLSTLRHPNTARV